MKQIRNKLTGEVVACQVIDTFSIPESHILSIEEWDGETREEFPNKLICVDNFDRDSVDDFLVAGSCNMSEAEYKELDRLINRDSSPNYFTQVDKSRELYKFVP